MNPMMNGTHYLHEGSNRLPSAPRLIVLGFYDGPTEGVIQLGDCGPVFRFDLLDEEQQLAAGRTARVYDFCPLPSDAFGRVVAMIGRYHNPEWPVWFPPWQFPSPQAEQIITEAVDAILAEAGPPQWRITTSADQTFEMFHAERQPVGQPA